MSTNLPITSLDINTIIDAARKELKNLSPEEKKSIIKAYEFANKAHEGSIRKSGEPYIQHPMHAAYYLITKLGFVDIPSICAALLHDTVEDIEEISIDLVKKEFGNTVAQLVEGMTKAGHIKYRGEDRQIETLRQMFIACAKDIRVIFIRLADRLHNMQTLSVHRKDKQLRIAEETLEIYVSLAERLNLWNIKTELEEECFKILHPKEHDEIDQKLKKIIDNTNNNINSASKSIKSLLAKNSLHTKVTGRIKNPYSIFKKMQKKNKTFEEIQDIFGIRIIAKSINDCYTILGIIHSKFHPIPQRFKDYIAVPKINGYQSLHTTVIFPKQQQPIEIQIRTEKMHEISERGAASHFIYSDQKKAVKTNSKQLQWIKTWVNLQNSLSTGEYLESFKTEFLTDEQKVYVFTPTNDIKYFPKGSTPLDFAYSIHTDIGHKFKNAIVNNRIVPLDYQLQNGDTIQIINNNEANPNINWINTVQTNQAKQKIRQYFTKLDKDSNIEEGKKLLDKELKVLGKSNLKEIPEQKKRAVAHELSYKTFEDILVAIGSIKMKPSIVITRLFPEDKLFQQKKEIIQPKLAKPQEKKNILIDGQKNILFELSKCCTPIYPNDIIGYIVSNGVVKIHKSDCPELEHMNLERCIDVEWEGQTKEAINISIDIKLKNIPGALREVTDIFFTQNINMTKIVSETINKYEVVIHFDLEIYNAIQFTKLIYTLNKADCVLSTKRIH